MRRLFLTISFIVFTINFAFAIINVEDIYKDAEKQIKEFFILNEHYRTTNQFDKLNYIFVYVPGEPFDFNRPIPDHLLNSSVQTNDWLYDPNNKIIASAATKFRADLLKYNNILGKHPGPDNIYGKPGTPEALDDTEKFYQHYVIIVDAPKNFNQGNLKSVPRGVVPHFTNTGVTAYTSTVDYETAYQNFVNNFQSKFDFTGIFGTNVVPIKTFVFSNPRVKNLPGFKTGLVTVPQVNLDIDIKQDFDGSIVFNPFSGDFNDVAASVYFSIDPGFNAVIDLVNFQIEEVHKNKPLNAYTTCEQFALQLNYSYSQNFYTPLCPNFPNNDNYHNYLKLSAVFLEFIAFSDYNSSLINYTLPNGQTYLQFVQSKIDAYGTQFGANTTLPADHFAIWLLQGYANENAELKNDQFILYYYRYFIDIDQTDGEVIINNTKAMFDLLNRVGETAFEKFLEAIGAYGNYRSSKIENKWTEFKNGIDYLTSGAYPTEIKTTMFNLLVENQETLWEHVLKPLPKDLGEYQGSIIPKRGVSSMEMGYSLANFIQKYYSETNPQLLNPPQTKSNIFPYINKNTLFSLSNNSYGASLVSIYLAVNQEFIANNTNSKFKLTHCTQIGLVSNSRYNCNQGLSAVNVPLVDDWLIEDKSFFDMIYAPVVSGIHYISDCSTCESNLYAAEPVFFTALKIKNGDFNRHLEQVGGAVALATLPFSASAAGIGSLTELIYFGGAISQANFGILQTIGSQTSLEYFQKIYGDEKGQEIFDDLITWNSVIGAPAVGLASFNMAKYASMIGRGKAFTNYQEVAGEQIAYNNFNLNALKSGTSKVENDLYQVAGKENIIDLVYNAKSGAYEIPGVVTSEILPYPALTNMMDRVRFSIIKSDPTQNAYKINLSLSSLNSAGKLGTFREALKEVEFYNWISLNASSVAQFSSRTKAWQLLNEIKPAHQYNLTTLIKLSEDILNNPPIESYLRNNPDDFDLWNEIKQPSVTEINSINVPYRSSVDFIECYKITKDARTISNSNPGALLKHLKGEDIVYYAIPNGDKIKEFTGMHIYKNVITEPSPIVLTGKVGSANAWTGPLPSAPANSAGFKFAIEDGTYNTTPHSGLVLIWGNIPDPANPGKFIEAWKRKANNAGYTSFFPADWPDQKVIAEIAFARSRLKLSDYDPNIGTNGWSIISSDPKVEIQMYIGNPNPTSAPDLNQFYGSAWSINY